MTKISQYALDSTISEKDKVLGTDFAGSGTKNFSVESLRDYFLEFVDGATTLSKTVTLTPAQMFDFNSGGQIEILPQPEAGKAYYIKTVQFHLDFNTTVYDANIDLRLMIANEDLTIVNTIYQIGYAFLNASSDISLLLFPGQYLSGFVHLRNDPLILWAPTVMSINQGDSNIKFKVNYEILDIEL